MRFALTSIVLGALACGGGGGAGGGGPTGSATVSGTFHARPFTPRDALSARVTGAAGSSELIILTDATGLCSQLSAGKVPRNTQFLGLTAENVQPGQLTTAPTSPGTYTMASSSSAAFAVFLAIDDNCRDRGPDFDDFGTSGGVTFTSVGSRFAGSFDISFLFDGHASGTFEAPDCPGLPKLVGDRSDLSCQ